MHSLNGIGTNGTQLNPKVAIVASSASDAAISWRLLRFDYCHGWHVCSGPAFRSIFLSQRRGIGISQVPLTAKLFIRSTDFLQIL
jgi:hypothetical protein